MPHPNWPELAWDAWQDTATTLHLWTQIVGKTRLALTPLQNHWWNVPLYVSARGLTTSPMPWRGTLLEIEFDFLAHRLDFRTSTGRAMQLPLEPRSVADFYTAYLQVLAALEVQVKLWPMPSRWPARFASTATPPTPPTTAPPSAASTRRCCMQTRC